MLSTLLLIAAASTDPVMYEERQLDVYAAAANGHSLDGLNYFDSGVLGGGIRFSDPSGWHFGADLMAGEGNGSLLPEDSITTLDSYLGWSWRTETLHGRFSIFDYRLRDGGRSVSSQGLRAAIGSGRIRLSASIQQDKPLYLGYADRYVHYDNWQVETQWSDRFTPELGWSVGAGYRELEDIEPGYAYASVALDGRYRQVHWQLALFIADNRADEIYRRDLDRESLVLRITVPFRLR